jgi:hypothetical protein
MTRSSALSARRKERVQAAKVMECIQTVCIPNSIIIDVGGSRVDQDVMADNLEDTSSMD